MVFQTAVVRIIKYIVHTFMFNSTKLFPYRINEDDDVFHSKFCD